jgi:type IV pilus assembly protein PilM
MKHRQVGMYRAGVLNSDGHAIGLDIGATGVRAAVLAPGTLEGRPSVTAHGLGRVELPPGAVVNGVVQQPAALTAALKRLWHENKFQCRTVILGVANPQVLVRDMSIPNLDPERRAKALPYQAKDIVALPINEVVLDFCALGEPDPETDTLQGLLVATPRQPILTAVAAVEKAQLRVGRVDLSSFGTLRSVADENLTVEAVVDFGAHLTTIVVHDHGVPKLVRTLARGGDELTNQVAERLSIAPVEAEQAKREQGLDGPNEELNRTLRDSLRPLLAEIRTSISYFRSTNDNVAIERMTLTGGGAQLTGLARTLSEQIGLPTRLADPLQHIRNRAAKEVRATDPAQLPSAVSVGLAMGAAA